MKTYAINKNIKLKKNNNFSYEINKKKNNLKCSNISHYFHLFELPSMIPFGIHSFLVF